MEEVFFGFLVGGVGFEVGESLAVGEAEEEGEVVAVIDDGSVTRDGAAVADAADEAGGLLEVLGGADEGRTVCGVAGALQPDEHGVLDLAAGRDGAGGGQERKQEDEPEHGRGRGI